MAGQFNWIRINANHKEKASKIDPGPSGSRRVKEIWSAVVLRGYPIIFCNHAEYKQITKRWLVKLRVNPNMIGVKYSLIVLGGGGHPDSFLPIQCIKYKYDPI